jgi:hypothetical protein
MTIAIQRFNEHRLKAGIVEQERKPFPSQRLAEYAISLQQIDTK